MPQSQTLRLSVIFLFCSWQNIRVMAKYYTRITLKRMAELLDLPVEVSDHHL